MGSEVEGWLARRGLFKIVLKVDLFPQSIVRRLLPRLQHKAVCLFPGAAKMEVLLTTEHQL